MVRWLLLNIRAKRNISIFVLTSRESLDVQFDFLNVSRKLLGNGNVKTFGRM